MGGAVSSGKDNDELVDNLRKDDYVKTCEVERVFRIVDRAHYYLAEYKDGAYKDLAWKCGTLHLSAPCIYSAVMEALELERGMSFLNLGSGTGYLNTMVGHMIGPYGTNHGIELHEDNVTYARNKLEGYITTSRKFDDMAFCEPQFVVGNCLNLAPDNQLYDRVYCGASCPQEEKDTLQNMLKITGILVVPIGDQLLKIRRVSETDFSSENVLPVSFASLVLPGPANKDEEPISLPEVNPLSLQCICRLAVREAIRKTFDFELPPPKKRYAPKPKKMKYGIFRRERGRYPLDIMPTSQGLMIVGAFNQSDDDDGDDEEEEDEDVNFEYLDRQLQRHALEITRVRERLGHTPRDPNIDEIDSDLSEIEDKGFADPNGNENVSTTLTTPNNQENPYSAMDTEGDLKEDDEGVEDDDELHEDKVDCPAASNLNIMLENEPIIENKADEKVEQTPLSQLGERSISLSSEEEVPSSASCIKSQAINMAVNSASGSQPMTIKSSYSTSADTSETSGFGSLIEDLPHIELPHSPLGSIQDNLSDEEESDDEKTGSLSYKADNPSLFRARHGLVLSKLLENDSDVNEENEVAEVIQDDSSDAGWMDISEGNDDSDENEEYGYMDAIERVKKAADACMTDETVEPSIPRGPDFSAFLKERVNTLPIPNSIKAFVLYFR